MSTPYDPEKAWYDAYSTRNVAYPPEYVIRIFKGNYPLHAFNKDQYRSQTILDVGCGDGRNFPLFNQCKFQQAFGTEINPDIVHVAQNNIAALGMDPSCIKVGHNHNLPFPDQSMDFLLSWNACYYMQDHQFEEYVNEFSRVCKKDGNLILSIPKSSCFIFKHSEDAGRGYRTITSDYFNGMRNGEVMRCFDNKEEIFEAFSGSFHDFKYASIHDDCFGLNYHWHLVICRKKA